MNKIQYQFYKRFCHLKKTTPNYCLIGEFGLQPIEFHFYKAALSYWTKLIKADKKCIIRQIYQHIYQNVENRQYLNTWCWQIMKLLQELNLENLWMNQDKENAVNYKFIINTRLKEYFREQWIQSAKHSHKGLNYLELALFNSELKSYLNLIINDQSVLNMLKLRTGNHTLSVEIDRYRNRKTYEECICNLCNYGNIEDIYHVIVICPRYDQMRKNDLQFLTSCTKEQLYAKLNKLKHSEIKRLTKFMTEVEAIKRNI